MLERTIKISGGGLLIFRELTEEPCRLTELYPEALSDNCYLKLANAGRQKEWLAVRLMLRAAGVNPEALEYTPEGKPEITDDKYAHISISHSGRLAGIFLHQTCRVGLDIESPDRNFSRISRKYLSTDEIELAQTIPNGAGLFWCVKEAAYKLADVPGLQLVGQIRIYMGNDGRLTVTAEADNGITSIINHLEIAGQLVVYLTHS